MQEAVWGTQEYRDLYILSIHNNQTSKTNFSKFLRINENSKHLQHLGTNSSALSFLRQNEPDPALYVTPINVDDIQSGEARKLSKATQKNKKTYDMEQQKNPP